MSSVFSESNAPTRVAVIKIGGSILTGEESYRRAAVFVAARHRARPDERLVIVVSAQEGVTDSLERAAREIVPEPQPAAIDLLWSTGEIRSVALVTFHLQALGICAAPLNIHQSGLAAQHDDSEAGRVHVNPRWLAEALAQSGIAIVPGFLASDSSGRIVSLGRGGSDLTAVLLAEGLRACRCELIKDVPGYFTADPHLNPAAQPIPHLTFYEALALADAGCDLVQRKAIVAAARCGLPLLIRTIDETTALTVISTTHPNAAWEIAAEPSATAAEAAC